GFLSQSSGWMHIGLGRRDDPVRVEVKWPNGRPEVFEGLEPDAFYVLRQGAGAAARWTPPQEGATFAGEAVAAELPPPSSEARIILPASLPLPALKQLDAKGAASPLELESGTTLINVWTAWCLPCREELASWSQAAPRIQEAGLHILAFNADKDEAGRAASAGLLEEMGFPFRWAAADPASLRALDLLQRASLDRWETMPVPCSFLVDANGYVMAIYKGSVSVETLLEDLSLEKASPEELRRAAIPFPGVWSHDPPTPDPLRVTAQFVDFALVKEGLEYLQKATAMDQQFRSGLFSQADFADRYLVAATLLKSQNMHEEALATYERARHLNPSDARIRGDLAAYHLERGRLEPAIEEWKAVLGLNPRDLETASRLAVTQLRAGQAKEALRILDQLVTLRPDQANFRYYQGLARQRTGDMQGAVEGIEQALEMEPDHALAMNSIAWISATHPDARWRDGARALELAQKLCERTQHRNLPFLMTLAAAQAEAGQFPEAVATTERAKALLAGRGGAKGPASPADLATVEARLALFEAGKPYRDETL
ncbi:MAG TPA: tetratricopeptide repeat protein, partial [Verrucomicrobiales bacterium]|nr:tetratricopeptide repeat protein [Verrucomicrobiales bacterium]